MEYLNMIAVHNGDMMCSYIQWWWYQAQGRWWSDNISVDETSTQTTDLYSLE